MSTHLLRTGSLFLLLGAFSGILGCGEADNSDATTLDSDAVTKAVENTDYCGEPSQDAFPDAALPPLKVHSLGAGEVKLSTGQTATISAESFDCAGEGTPGIGALIEAANASEIAAAMSSGSITDFPGVNGDGASAQRPYGLLIDGKRLFIANYLDGPDLAEAIRRECSCGRVIVWNTPQSVNGD